MKYLSDYMESKHTELWNSTGTFFAFSTKQFKDQEVEGTEYVFLGSGMYTPKKHANKVIEQGYKIYKDSIKQDIKENGKNKIILRELLNHEAFYVGNTEETITTLEDYPITEKEIINIYNKNFSKYADQ